MYINTVPGTGGEILPISNRIYEGMSDQRKAKVVLAKVDHDHTMTKTTVALNLEDASCNSLGAVTGASNHAGTSGWEAGYPDGARLAAEEIRYAISGREERIFNYSDFWIARCDEDIPATQDVRAFNDLDEVERKYRIIALGAYKDNSRSALDRDAS